MPTLFAAGPAGLPECVLKEASEAVINYNDLGYSILSLSHRSQEFQKILSEAESLLRDLVGISSDFDVLWMQGGATLQFAAAPLNIGYSTRNVSYCISGSWSRKASQEAKKLGFNVTEFSFDSKVEPSLFTYFCTNETIDGIQLPTTFASSLGPNKGYVIADMSSDFLSRKIQVDDYDIIFAGAQKNLGCAGVTIVIVRKNILKNTKIPTMLDYKICSDNNSCYNTPPVFAIYCSMLYLRWINKKGVQNVFDENQQKAKLIYDFLDNNNSILRSITNICFRLKDEETEMRFIKMAEKQQMLGLKGHRDYGGVRVSLYNSVSLDDVKKLILFMSNFK